MMPPPTITTRACDFIKILMEWCKPNLAPAFRAREAGSPGEGCLPRLL
jgi:hypothetical protein